MIACAVVMRTLTHEGSAVHHYFVTRQPRVLFDLLIPLC